MSVALMASIARLIAAANPPPLSSVDSIALLARRPPPSPLLYLYLSIYLSRRKKLKIQARRGYYSGERLGEGGGIKAARVNWRDRGKKNRDREKWDVAR